MEAADLDPDPIVQLQRWIDDASAAGLHEPTAMALATAGHDGRPVVRHVLLRGLDGRGLAFYTNYGSRKGRHLAENPWASVVFPWFAIGRQVIVTGTVDRLTAEESDAYFASRPRGSQLGAWASDQSDVIPSREDLERRLAEFTERFEGQPVPRPPDWGGYRLIPAGIEFWHHQPNRLHDRIRYTRDESSEAWQVDRLSP